jgi:hypothetical protein
VQLAGQTAEWEFLDAVTDSNEDIADPDSVPAASLETSIPAYDGTNNTIITLQSFTVDNNYIVSAIAELEATNPNICIYVVMENPGAEGYPIPAACYYEDNSRTAALDGKHLRGTLPNRLVTRIAEGDNAYVIDTGEGTPGVFRLVTIPSEVQPPPSNSDAYWSGADYTIWTEPSSNSYLGWGNYGRMHYVRVEVSNSAAYDLNFGAVANPRTPSSDYYGAVRDVTRDTLTVPSLGLGVVPSGEGYYGTVIWKGVIEAGNQITKRFYYTPAGGSSSKLSIWVVPYSGSL